MDLLDNRIMEYAWGSRTVIAELLGQAAPSARPQAELWMGAHPNAPSMIRRGGRQVSLCDAITASPEAELGKLALAKFGPRLPFLLKVLAADTPLSLQAHPDMDQAREGFAADEAARIPLDAAQRKYKDPSHKPELLCALTRFEALSGFRRATDTLRLFRTLRVGALSTHTEALAREPSAAGLRTVYASLISMNESARREVVASTVEACGRHRAEGGEFARECDWVLRIGALYPSDIGVTVSLLLNLIELEPAQAIYLPAGNLHAYLRGAGVEIMANSDNVLRGGLTPKYVDSAELLRVLSFADAIPSPLLPRADVGPEQIYDTPAAEFRLSRIEVGQQASFRAEHRDGPEILLCVRGSGEVRSRDGATLALTKGASIFVPAGDGPYELHGAASIFRATVGTF